MMRWLPFWVCQSIALHTRTHLTISAVSEICGDPPSINNAAWQIVDRYGSGVRYTCFDGYVVSGSRDVSFVSSCSGTSREYENLKTCVSLECSPPPFLANSEVSVGSLNYNSTAMYTCKAGYTGDGLVRGPVEIWYVCGLDGEFAPLSPQITKCSEIQCGLAPKIRNANLTNFQVSEILSLGSVAQYVCTDPGSSGVSLDLQGANASVLNESSPANFQLTCEPDGTFSPYPIPVCADPVCSAPPEIPFSKAQSDVTSVPVDGLVIYDCTSGYGVNGQSGVLQFGVRCSVDEFGRTSLIAPSAQPCEPLPCGPLPTIPKASLSPSSPPQVFSSISRFDCIKGNTVDGDIGASEIYGSCDSTGIWSVTAPQGCSPVVCGNATNLTPELLLYGEPLPYAFGSAHYGSSPLSIACVNGSVASGGGKDTKKTTIDAVCGAHGIFEYDSQGVCSYPCTTPTVINGTTNTTWGMFGWDPAMITCNLGFTPLGTGVGKRISTFNATCGRNGEWDQLVPCVPVRCKIPDLTNKNSSLTNVLSSTSVPYQTFLNVSCDSGYYLPSHAEDELPTALKGTTEFSIMCGAQGIFSDMPTCQRMPCGAAPEVKNAKPVTNIYRLFRFGDHVTYSCNDGYGPTPKIDAICSAGGQWALDGACVRNSANVKGGSTDSNATDISVGQAIIGWMLSGKIITLIVIGALAIIALLFFAFYN